jgi:uncharacterized membrane protein
MNWFKEIIIPTIILLLLDSIYLSLIYKQFESQIISIQKVSLKMRYLGAIICYIALITGLYYFILKPHRSIIDAFILGIVIYGVYETTNYATLKNWDMKFVIIDTIWGGLLFAFTTYFTYKLQSKM